MASTPVRTAPSTGLTAVALGTVYVVWGSTYLAIGVGLESFTPFLFAAARFLVAGGLMLLWVRLRRGPGHIRVNLAGAGLRSAAIVGALLLFGGNGGVSWAEQTLHSGSAALIVSAMPLWMASLDRIVYGTRLAARTRLGIAIGLAGVVLLIQPFGQPGPPVLPALAVLGAALSWAWGSLWSRHVEMPEDGQVATAVEMLAGGVLLLLLGLVTWEPGRLDLADATWTAWFSYGYLVFAGSLLAFTAYGWLLRNVRTSLTTTYAYVNPVVAVFLGWALNDEPLSARTVVAGAIIVSGVFLMITSRPVAPPLSAAEPAA